MNVLKHGAITGALGLIVLCATGAGLAGCPPSGGSGLTAAFSAAPTSGGVPLTVQFTDESVSPDGPIVSWLWIFGDGRSSTAQNPIHTYLVDGEYSVTLLVSDGASQNQIEKSGLITVGTGGDQPIANFEGRPHSGTAPHTVQFLDQSLDGGAEISFREWDFGDGNTSSDENPRHTYERPGLYSVSLTLGNDNGTDSQTQLEYIEVLP